MSKHTPGPWTVTDHGMERISVDSSMSVVCTIDGASQWSASHTRENAKLIAISPSLMNLAEDLATLDIEATDDNLVRFIVRSFQERARILVAATNG